MPTAALSTIPSEKEERDLVKDLAEAVSTQAQVANRYWLTLITVAAFAVIPHTLTSLGNISLPFNLGEVPPAWFHGLVFLFLIVIAVAFAAAHAQQIHAQELAHSVIKSMNSSSGPIIIRPRDYFDILRKPSLTRVAPLAQSVNQLLAASCAPPKWLQLLTEAYYLILKTLSFLIYFGLPMLATCLAHRSFAAWGLLNAGKWVATSVAVLALTHVLYLDLRYAVRIRKDL